MLVIECDCGADVPFIAEDGATAPITEQCEECDQTWKLSVKRVVQPTLGGTQ